jgi:hypothetical protein
VPGQSIACASPSCSGAQVCLSDGSGYGPCVCPGGPSDGGSSIPDAATGALDATLDSTSAAPDSAVLDTGAMADAPSCEAGEALCAGACLDLQSDPANCGSCGHDCEGAECASGGCVPTTLATGASPAQALAVTAQSAFWVSGPGFEATLSEVPLDGGAIVPRGSNLWGLTGLAADSANVYWFQNYIGNVLTACAVDQLPLAGGATITLATPDDGVIAIGVNSSAVFFITNYDAIWSAPIGGASPATPVVTGQSYLGAFAVDESNVYWTTFENPVSQVLKATTGGVSVTPLVANIPSTVESIAVDATNVYFASEPADADGGTYPGGIYSTPIAGGAVTRLGDYGSPLMVDATNVYFGVAQGVSAIPKAGGAPIPLMTHQPIFQQFFAVGPNAIYAPEENGDIVQVPK